MNDLFKTIESLNEEYLQFLIDICSIESPTECKAGVDSVGEYIEEKARKKGWLTERERQEISGDVWCITMNADAEGAPVCLSGHMDTVHPVGSFGYPCVRMDSENIYGPGVCDCKGGIAAAFMAMDALERCGFSSRPIKLILQSDEENGSRNSAKATVRYMAKKAEGCAAFLNAEPGNSDGHSVSSKGICKFRFDITGKAAHSCACNEGASAICEAAHKIIRLEQFKNADHILCNCGLISGGSAENTVPEKCTFTADFRYTTPEQYDEILTAVNEVSSVSHVEGTSCTYTLASSRCAMAETEKNLELFEKVGSIYAKLGLGKMEKCEASGASDAADLTQMGIPCLDGFGLIGGNIHRLSEFARLDSLITAAKRMASVAWCIE